MLTVWPELSSVLHPNDRPPPSSWAQCYETKHAIACLLQPKRILEIGVRAGYSALAFLRAVPTASYLGIDANNDQHGGFHGSIEHARRLLADFDARILEMASAEFASSTEFRLQNPYDLINHKSRWRALVIRQLVRLAVGQPNRFSASAGR